jgi:hypothetical protein
MAGYGDESFDEAMRWRVAFVGGPWDGKCGRYYGLEGFPEMPVANGRYVFADVDDDGDVIYYYFGGDDG